MLVTVVCPLCRQPWTSADGTPFSPVCRRCKVNPPAQAPANPRRRAALLGVGLVLACAAGALGFRAFRADPPPAEPAHAGPPVAVSVAGPASLPPRNEVVYAEDAMPMPRFVGLAPLPPSARPAAPAWERLTAEPRVVEEPNRPEPRPALASGVNAPPHSLYWKVRQPVKPSGSILLGWLQPRDEAALREELDGVKEIRLDPNDKQEVSKQIAEAAKTATRTRPDDPPPMPKIFAEREDLTGLPFRNGPDCRLSKSAAQHLQKRSAPLRSVLPPQRPSVPEHLFETTEQHARIRAIAKLRDGSENLWTTPNAVPALSQLLEAENGPMRALLVEMLARIEGPESSAALAKRAVFDLSPQVREAAIAELRKRPPETFRPVLLEGLRHPWQPAAAHAAEALVALQDVAAIPKLVDLLDAPNPVFPEEGAAPQVREVVRVNHFRNCLLCHAASTGGNDLVRGFRPVPGEPIPELYYASRSSRGNFVRADVTYLRQDFSVRYPVKDAKPWPAMQRFDFVVRVRPGKPEEVVPRGSYYPQREAVRLALRGLAGFDAGDRSEDWRPFLRRPDEVPKELRRSGLWLRMRESLAARVE